MASGGVLENVAGTLLTLLPKSISAWHSGAAAGVELVFQELGPSLGVQASFLLGSLLLTQNCGLYSDKRGDFGERETGY